MKMKLNRRQALQATAALCIPSLITNIQANEIKIPLEKIPTGFPTLDKALQGGLKQGSMASVVGETDSGKTAFLRSMAINAAQTHKIAYIPPLRFSLPIDKKVKQYDPRLFHQKSDPQQIQKLLEELMKKYDMIIEDSNLLFKLSDLSDQPFTSVGWKLSWTLMAQEHNCCLVSSINSIRSKKQTYIENYDIYKPIHYSDSTIFTLKKSQQFNCCITKNRFGENQIANSMTLNTNQFIMKEV